MQNWPIGCVFAAFALIIANVVALVTHIVTCIQAGAWILLGIGCLLPFIGVIHGWMIWFGASWAGG